MLQHGCVRGYSVRVCVCVYVCSQLDGATHALERHRQGVRVAHTRDDNTSTWVDDGLSGAEDDRSSLGGYGSD